MRAVRYLIAVVLGLTLSPLVITHRCGLSSTVLEIPIIVVSEFVIPLVVLRPRAERNAWLLVGATSAVALVITLAYFDFLHSSYFPERLLDESAVRWRMAKESP
jgi:hypothetical protein